MTVKWPGADQPFGFPATAEQEYTLPTLRPVSGVRSTGDAGRQLSQPGHQSR